MKRPSRTYFLLKAPVGQRTPRRETGGTGSARLCEETPLGTSAAAPPPEPERAAPSAAAVPSLLARAAPRPSARRRRPRRTSRLGPTEGSCAPPDVITRRRRFASFHSEGEVVGANGSRAPLTDPPARRPARPRVSPWAAMVSPRGRPRGSGAWERLRAGCGRGARGAEGWGRTGAWPRRGARHGRDPRPGAGRTAFLGGPRAGFGAARHFPSFPPLGEGRTEESLAGMQGRRGQVVRLRVAPDLGLGPTESVRVLFEL